MRKLIRDYVEVCSKTLNLPEPIYEFGSFQVQGQEKISDLRPFFPKKKYVGADMREGKGVDKILNLHKINLPSKSVGTVLCLDTFEHVEFPWKAIKEIYRILKPNGVVIISSVMNFGIHDYPNDYWRFTPEAFKSLLKEFKKSFVYSVGKVSFPHTIIGVGFKESIDRKNLNNFFKNIRSWKKYWEESPIIRLKKLVTLFTPPIILETYYKIKRILNEKN